MYACRAFPWMVASIILVNVWHVTYLERMGNFNLTVNRPSW